MVELTRDQVQALVRPDGRVHLDQRDRRRRASTRRPRRRGSPRSLPDDAEVQTADESADEAADEINDQIGSFLTPALLALAGRRGPRRRLHHLQHLLDHRRPADARVRDAARARRHPRADPRAVVAARRWLIGLVASRARARAPGSASRSCSTRSSTPSASASRAPASSSPPRTVTSRSRSGSASTLLAALVPGAARDAGRAGRRDGGRRAAARAGARGGASRDRCRRVPARRPRPDGAGAVRIGRRRPASSGRSARRDRDLHRRRALGPLPGPPARRRDRLADRADLPDPRPARARERRAQSRPHRRHLGRADGRPRPGRLRRRLRRRAQVELRRPDRPARPGRPHRLRRRASSPSRRAPATRSTAVDGVEAAVPPPVDQLEVNGESSNVATDIVHRRRSRAARPTSTRSSGSRATTRCSRELGARARR